MKKALITGITGQDGSYLAEFLLQKGYEVHGIKRRASSFNTSRIDHIYQGNDKPDRKFFLHYGDLADSSSLVRLVGAIQPDEIYNLAAQSHVKVSFENPEYTAEINGLGTLRLLEAIRLLGFANKTRFYQASTSELYGNINQIPQMESTPFYPRSPYACSKLFAYWIVVNYRESYGMYACNGILFNHESPRRGETFVTRKVTRGFARSLLGLNRGISLGNLNARRDWGHARDYVQMQWLMLQQDKPEDFVIATGLQISVRDFCSLVAKEMGLDVEFIGNGVAERGIVRAIDHDLLEEKYSIDREMCHLKAGDTLIKVDERYFRPAEVETLLGNASKASEKLGWNPSTTINDLVREMSYEDIINARKDALLKASGFAIIDPHD